jgi:hypothetical protein
MNGPEADKLEAYRDAVSADSLRDRHVGARARDATTEGPSNTHEVRGMSLESVGDVTNACETWRPLHRVASLKYVIIGAEWLLFLRSYSEILEMDGICVFGLGFSYC